MATNNINIEFGRDITEFLATRLVVCTSVDCANNNTKGVCMLKRVDIGKCGNCLFYAPPANTTCNTDAGE